MDIVLFMQSTDVPNDNESRDLELWSIYSIPIGLYEVEKHLFQIFTYDAAKICCHTFVEHFQSSTSDRITSKYFDMRKYIYKIREGEERLGLKEYSAADRMKERTF